MLGLEGREVGGGLWVLGGLWGLGTDQEYLSSTIKLGGYWSTRWYHSNKQISKTRPRDSDPISVHENRVNCSLGLPPAGQGLVLESLSCDLFSGWIWGLLSVARVRWTELSGVQDWTEMNWKSSVLEGQCLTPRYIPAIRWIWSESVYPSPSL